MKWKILVITRKDSFKVFRDIFQDYAYEIYYNDDIDSAKKSIRKIKPDIILLDYLLVKDDNLNISYVSSKNVKIPTIIVSNDNEGCSIKKAFDLGACDYLRKPLNAQEVICRIKMGFEIIESQKKLRITALKDGLTGLYNYTSIMELLEKEVKKIERNKNSISFVMVDIDYFKEINDQYGHECGNIILKEVAKILLNSVRCSDTVGRYGGEEYSIILPNTNDYEAFMICERIRRNIESYNFLIDNDDINITVSIGIFSTNLLKTINHQEIVKLADKALYTAKKSGRNIVVSSTKDGITSKLSLDV